MSTLLRDWVASRAPPAPPPTDAGPAARAARAPSLLEQLPSDALVLICDALPPATVAGPLAAASRTLRDVATGGDAWRLRFEPRLPRAFVEELDRAAPGAWPRVYGALAGNLLAGAATWRGVEGGGMRAWLPSRDGELREAKKGRREGGGQRG